MKMIASIARTVFMLCSAAIIVACGGGTTSNILPPNITVTVTAGANSVEATGSTSLTAVVTGDSAGKGVTWSVSCGVTQCGSVSAAGPSGVPGTYNANYTAPSTPPANDLPVTVKAVSVTDGSKSGSAALTVSAITMSFNISGTGITASTPTTAIVQVGTGNAVQINLTVNNDPSNQGAKFTISPNSQSGNLTVQDSFNATYNAPSTPPTSDLTVTVTATSVEDSTKLVTLAITVPSVTVSITPLTATVDAQGTVSVTATIGNDSSNKGVIWAVSCSATPCGSIPNGPTLSGKATTYSAPTTPPDPSDLIVTVTATSVADAPAQATMTITVKAISVAVTVPNNTVLFGTTQPNIVATVSFDPANKGVTWALQPCDAADCGSIAPTATPSGAAITYTAPANPPASDVQVNIVATSDSDPNQQGSIQLTIPAITITMGICTDASCSVLASSAIIPTNAAPQLNTTPLNGNINNDSSKKGVSWTLTQGSSACTDACGTISATTASGTPATYTAPATVPANANVTVTATSIADPTKTATAQITLTSGTVKLIPAKLDFGGLKKNGRFPHPSKKLTETVINAGGSALNISGQATDSAQFSVTAPCQGNITTSIASGSACGIDVTFAPTALGQFNGNLVITDNDATSPQQVPLSGKACSGLPCIETADFRSALAKNQMAEVPTPRGTYRVGTRMSHVVDEKRADPYLLNGKERELLVRFWYPAAANTNCTPAEYTSPGVWNYLAQIEKVAPFKVKTNSCTDAPVATGKHPVVVFTHGYTGTFTDYTFLFEDLASRGYVVASVNHTYEATAVQFPDGRLVKSLVGTHLGPSLQLDAKAISFAVAVRLADLKSVMDELEHINAKTDNSFYGKLDLSRVALAGHSLGGMTALLGLEMDPRFKAALSIDGIPPGALFGATDKPTLMLFAGRDAWDQDTCRAWEKLEGQRFALNLIGSEHLTPSDAVWLAKGAVQTGPMGLDKTVEAIRSYIAAFLNSSLNGNAVDKLLEGASPDYPDVEVITQTQLTCGKATK